MGSAAAEAEEKAEEEAAVEAEEEEAFAAALLRVGDMRPRADEAPAILLEALGLPVVAVAVSTPLVFAFARGRICAARLPPAHSSV